jgi:hypothetical protein
MDKITQILENVVRCKYFEACVHIKNPIKNSYQDGLRTALHKESRPSKVGAVSTKILALMAPRLASSGHFNKSITGAKTLVCKGLGAKESRPLYKALENFSPSPSFFFVICSSCYSQDG